MKSDNKLALILEQKRRDVDVLHQKLTDDIKHPIANVLRGELKLNRPVSFKKALKSPGLTVIAEIKRKSPSKGKLAPIADPVALARRYIAGKAGAISILTDHYFGGDIHDLVQVADAVREQSIPILQKDFIIDTVQIAEAAVAGASAVLCIVSVVGNKARELIAFAHSINLDVLVEIYDREELMIALNCGADIIVINNRNLKTFAVDTSRSLDIVEAIPDTIIKVAASGIDDPMLARQYYQARFDAVLIGEALVKHANPEQFITECHDA